MKILIASDSFKGSFSSMAAANYIEAGVRKIFKDAEIIKMPVADGGEGTVDALIAGGRGRKYGKIVTGPLGEAVQSEYGILNNGTAVIEMAAAAGLPLVPEGKRNPLVTTTYGVGELILEVMNQGCNDIIMGLGGSATNDGGVGMAQALGVSFKDSEGNEIGFGGGHLSEIASIDVSSMKKGVAELKITIASDVVNPLCGPLGASAVYGPQKGADGAMIEVLDKGLKNLAEVVYRSFRIDMAEKEGSGAAGGLGYGLMVFCKAIAENGIDTVLRAQDFARCLKDCDLVITGEGRVDRQSAMGKVPAGIAGFASKVQVPVLVIGGGIEEGAEGLYDLGVGSIAATVNKAMTLEEAMARGPELLENAAERAVRMIKIGMEMKRVSI